MRLLSRLLRAFRPTRHDQGPHLAQAVETAAASGELSRLSHEQVGTILRALRQAGHALPAEELQHSVTPEQFDHLVYALHRSGGLARLTPGQVRTILHTLREAGHRLGPVLPAEELLASVAPEQLDHLVHALHRSGGLARLTAAQVETILRALRLANPAAPTRPRKQRHLTVDIIGTCNLRCPSCPVGNMGASNPSGLMELELFKEIFWKARREYPIEVVYLYNWTEPLLHPKLPAFISFVRSQGMPCGLSSNLNNLKNIDAVIAARPTSFRISLSGFSQGVYGQTHAAGDIERVKRNMAVLSETIRRQNNHEIGVHVYFHKYRHNLHEIEPMRRYAASLGFDWHENWAFLQPVEKALDLIEGRLPPEQRAFAEQQYALPLLKAIDAARMFRDEPCEIIDDLTIDVQGYLTLCCATYDADRVRLGYFLDMSVEDVKQAKARHSLCGQCTEHGLHMHYRYDHHPALQPIHDELARQQQRQPKRPRGRASLPVIPAEAA